MNDIMQIKTPFLRGIASKAIDSAIKSKTGYEVKSQINDFEVEIGDKSKVHIDLDISIDKDELIRILEPLGLI